MGQIGELLSENCGRGFHEQLRLGQGGLAEPVEDLGEPVAAAALIVGLIAGGQAGQVGDQFATVGYAAGAELAGDAGLHDLLGPARTYLEDGLEGLAIDPGPGESVQFLDDRV